MTKKVYKYATEKNETEFRQADKSAYKSTHDMAVEQVSDFDSNFISKMCGGTGSTIADVIIYDRETKEELFKFPLRILSMKEEQNAIVEALAEYNKLPELSRVPALLAMMQATARIRKAMTPNPKDDKPICGDATFNRFTLKQIQMIHEKYETLADIISPCLDIMDDEEIERLVHEIFVKKNFDILTNCSHLQLRKALIYSSESIQPLLTANSSIGE